jgi:hypothetical protein
VSVVKLTLIICDKCNMTYADGDYKQASANDQRDKFVYDGWINKGKKDYCYNCKESL